METSSDTESSSSESVTESILIQKLIKNHRYIITIDGNQSYYGTCQCPDSYLFSGVMHFNLYKYIELKSFSEKDHFVDTHEKMD